MITFFTIPKPFSGNMSVIQRNAIQSWTRLAPPCEVILCGDDDGVADTARQLGILHLPGIARNQYGTPLLDSAFRLAAENARFPLTCYLNADIMLTSEFPRAAQIARLRRFLMVGQRWDVHLAEPWDFSSLQWEERLRRYVREKGILHPAAGSDYFLFPTGDALGELPPFAVGRPGWDNWLLGRARWLGVAVIDATEITTVVHQDHDYGHVKNGKGDSYSGREAEQNLAIAGNPILPHSLNDASHILTIHGPRRAFTKRHLRRRLQRLISEHLLLFVTHGLFKIAGSRMKRLFVPYPNGYQAPRFGDQIRGLFRKRNMGNFALPRDRK